VAASYAIFGADWKQERWRGELRPAKGTGRPSRGGAACDLRDLLQLFSDLAFRRPHIEFILQVQPKLGRRPERLAKP
jgi:hypothetical protein